MDHVQLGSTGVTVSRVILGCGNFGGIGSSPAFFGRGTSKADAFALMDAAWDAGITTFDTADAYGGGRSESFIGEWLATKPTNVRDRLVIATKTYNPMDDGADRGLKPARIARQIDSSLARLGVERVAMYLAHDCDTKVRHADTMGAFDDLVTAGKVGAVGASNFTATQLSAALKASAANGLVRYEWVQNSFSLLEQSDNDKLLPLCAEQGLGYTPFSPLAGGWLTGKYRRDGAPPPGSRMTLRPEPYESYRTPRVFDALDRLRLIAGEHSTSMAALSLAWLLAQPGITAVVIGPNHLDQLTPALDAARLSLPPTLLDEVTESFHV